MALLSIKRKYPELPQSNRDYNAKRVREILYECAPPVRESRIYEIGGCFELDSTPDGLFSIGGYTYVYSIVFQGESMTHIRRFEKYGDILYPTKEGVVLPENWISGYLLDTPPKTTAELFKYQERGDGDVVIESEDFKTFTVNRIKVLKSGDVSRRSVKLSISQWQSLINQRDEIIAFLWESKFSSLNIMEYIDFFLNFPNIGKELPDCLDFQAGRLCLLKILKFELIKMLKEKGLQEPYFVCEGELKSNKLTAFNDSISEIHFETFILYFSECQSMTVNKDLCLGEPAQYVTVSFLKNICFKSLLREVREFFCPPCSPEGYFQDEM